MAQLMPLQLTVSCFNKIQIGFTFLVLAHPGSPGQRAVKQVCVLGYDILVAVLSLTAAWLCMLVLLAYTMYWCITCLFSCA